MFADSTGIQADAIQNGSSRVLSLGTAPLRDVDHGLRAAGCGRHRRLLLKPGGLQSAIAAGRSVGGIKPKSDDELGQVLPVVEPPPRLRAYQELGETHALLQVVVGEHARTAGSTPGKTSSLADAPCVGRNPEGQSP
jgi:hypothetical protein